MAVNTQEIEDWAQQSGAKLGHAEHCKDRVKKTLLDLEQKHADKVAAIMAERERQKRLAAARAAREKREQERRQREAYKRMQAEELQRKKDAVKAGNRAEAQALKEATLAFLNNMKADNFVQLKNKRIADIKRSESILMNSYIACQKQYKMWFVAVQACEMRLQAREKRPTSELVVDHVQIALERELSTITEARKALKELVDAGEKLNADLSETMTLIVTGSSRDNVMRRRKEVETTLLKSSSLPQIPSVPPSPAEGSNSVPHQLQFFQSMNSMFQTDVPSQEELLDRARDQVNRALELATECNAVLENCQRNCNKVMAATNASLDQRKAEIDEIRKSLEQEKKEAAGSVKDAAHRIMMLKMKAKHHPQTPEEEAELEAFESVLQELRDAKLQLDEDWRAKHAAFKIDASCRNLTPVHAATLFSEPKPPQLTPLGSSENFPEFDQTQDGFHR